MSTNNNFTGDPNGTLVAFVDKDFHNIEKWLKKLLIVKQILIVSTLGDVERTVWRICIMMLVRKGLSLLLLYSINTYLDCIVR